MRTIIHEYFQPLHLICAFLSGCVLANMPSNSLLESPGYNQIPKEELLLFHSFKSVMEVFNNPKYRDLYETKQLLFDFNNKCLDRHFYELPIRGKSRKPFIVVEGNQRTSRKIMARRIARRMGATYLTNLPSCLVRLTNMFPYGSILRRSYFGLCMYAQARHIQWLYNRWPVVLNGYYYDQASFSIAQAYANITLPPPGDPLYAWPEDLLKPDLIFYVDFPDNLHGEPATTRHPSSWKPRMMKVYKAINDSSIIFVNTRKGLDYVEDLIMDKIVERLPRDVTFTAYARGEAPLVKPKRLRDTETTSAIN